MRTTRGFTSIEAMISLVIVGIMGSMAFPRLSSALEGVQLRAAQQSVAWYLARARASAIHNGRTTQFIRSGNTIFVAIDSAGTPVTLAPRQNLYEAHRATIETARDTILFDARGFAVGLTGAVKIFVVHEDRRDSVCVIGLGKVFTKGCGL